MPICANATQLRRVSSVSELSEDSSVGESDICAIVCRVRIVCDIDTYMCILCFYQSMFSSAPNCLNWWQRWDECAQLRYHFDDLGMTDRRLK